MAKSSTSFNFGANKRKKVRDIFDAPSRKPRKGKGSRGKKGGGS